MMTFDNDGAAEDSATIIDQLENDFQEAMIFGEEVAKTLLQLLMQYYDSEDYMYWLFGWLTGFINCQSNPIIELVYLSVRSHP